MTELPAYVQFGLALLFVLGLILLLAALLRKLGFGARMPGLRSRDRRLAILESLQIDPKRRLLLIRRDRTEHLLLLGPDHDTVIETVLRVDDGADTTDQPDLPFDDPDQSPAGLSPASPSRVRDNEPRLEPRLGPSSERV